jgi:uncharacterized DUF497 family protein
MMAVYYGNIHFVLAVYDELNDCVGFEWDDGNRDKNWRKHRVADSECEQVFFSAPLIVLEDVAYSRSEPRFYALGQSDAGRLLFIVFTIRDKLVRVISARDMTRRETRRYQREQE